MGQGGYLTLRNNTPHEWKRDEQNSYQMNAWDFPERIPAHEDHKVYIEYDEGPFKTKTDDYGNVTYKLGNSDLSFQIQARAAQEGSGDYHPNLRADIQDLLKKSISPDPAAIINLGWAHDGNVDFSLSGK
ncbi:hypothetical protein ACIBI9_31790 [Nonomuraea sp. NPDC050451]|uniref:hypothetical protein n=1 Tax=Nonomuraea sp. NPDC050451 TaxID=3364364 RepID=UPI00379E7B8B